MQLSSLYVQGVRTLVASNEQASEQQIEEGRNFNETWTWWPDDVPQRSMYVSTETPQEAEAGAAVLVLLLCSLAGNHRNPAIQDCSAQRDHISLLHGHCLPLRCTCHPQMTAPWQQISISQSLIFSAHTGC